METLCTINLGRTVGRPSFSTAKATKLDWQEKPGASFGGELHRKQCMQGEVAEDGKQIDRALLRETLSSLPPVTVEVVSQTAWEPLWDDLVRSHHYLGYQRLLGRRLKYLAFIGKRPVAALSFSAPALRLGVRDRYIGWSIEQRRCFLHHIIGNSRFVIFPWIDVKHLASQVLSRAVRRLPRDWQERYGIELWLVETFIDPARFRGTSYKAANWTCLGSTYGSTKQGRGYVYHGRVKGVYVYVLEPHFRKRIGCHETPPRPSRYVTVEANKMIIRPENWNPDVVPWMKLTEKDVRAMADELVKFHEYYNDCFGRIEHQRLGLAYVSGLLSNSPAKSVEPIALELLGAPAVSSLQKFMKTYRWDHEAMQAKHQELLSEQIATADGMITVDSCESVKKGKESVGVARQYCGEVGKVENCQSGVFVGYSSEKGYGLLSCRLYMPQRWFTEEYEERRKDTLVPEDLVFQTKPEIAGDLIGEIIRRNRFSAKWVGCDAVFGSDWDFLESLPSNVCYFASIHSNARVFLKKPRVGLPPYSGRGPRPQKPCLLRGRSYSVREVARSKKCSWSKVVLAEGAKGPIVADVAYMRVYPSRDGLPYGDPLWLFIRRTADGELKYAFSNARADIPFEELCTTSTMRWPIEQCFQDGKSHLGMNQYEHRSWPAWHRHMIYVFLALHFLLRLRLRFKKNSCVDFAPSKITIGDSTAAQITNNRGCLGDFTVPYDA
jgi:SRSO17 transposase